jgi:hypothetical protein
VMWYGSVSPAKPFLNLRWQSAPDNCGDPDRRHPTCLLLTRAIIQRRWGWSFNYQLSAGGAQKRLHYSWR